MIIAEIVGLNSTPSPRELQCLQNEARVDQIERKLYVNFVGVLIDLCIDQQFQQGSTMGYQKLFIDLDHNDRAADGQKQMST